MSDPYDRLRSADPVGHVRYELPDRDGLIQRALAQPRSTSRRTWRRFQITVAGSLAATTALAVTGIAVLSGAGSALPVFALASSGHYATVTSHASAFGVNGSPAYSMVVSPAPLPKTASSAPAYPLLPAPPAAQAAQRIASLFGLRGVATRAHSRGAATSWLVGRGTGPALNYQPSPVAQWYYSSSAPPVAPATVSNPALGPLVSHARLGRDASGLVAALGVSYHLTEPQFSSAVTATTRNASERRFVTETVTYAVTLGKLATGYRFVVTVDRRNHILFASGPAFAVGAPVTYPLESPRDALRALARERRALALPSAPTPALALTLSTYRLRSGATWLLPTFHVVAAAGSWNVVALQPRYVTTTSGSAPAP